MTVKGKCPFGDLIWKIKVFCRDMHCNKFEDFPFSRSLSILILLKYLSVYYNMNGWCKVFYSISNF